MENVGVMNLLDYGMPIKLDSLFGKDAKHISNACRIVMHNWLYPYEGCYRANHPKLSEPARPSLSLTEAISSLSTKLFWQSGMRRILMRKQRKNSRAKSGKHRGISSFELSMASLDAMGSISSGMEMPILAVVTNGKFTKNMSGLLGFVVENFSRFHAKHLSNREMFCSYKVSE